MRWFRPLKEQQVLRHVEEQSHDQVKELHMMHYGYLSSRVYLTTRRKWFRKVTYAEFAMALETKGQPLRFTVYRAFGKLAEEVKDYRLGDRLYILCTGVKDQEEKWYLALEIEPVERLGRFPVRYKHLMAPDKLNKLKE
ncbi:MAG: hypothetical protein M0Z31_05715 [Clostridia bacterium]|nr:hypothetical protein [Clostridia bacterium]